MVIQNKFAEVLNAANVFNKIAKEAAVRSRGTCVFPAEHPKVSKERT